MNHEVEVSNLMFNKSTNEPIDFKKYDINVDLEEDSSNDGKTILKYSLDLTSNPKNSVINISGNTILSGEKEEIEDFLKQETEKTPEVVSLIYQELFPLMYIITKNMKIPAPSHTISQSEIKEKEEQAKQSEDKNQTKDNMLNNDKKIENEATNLSESEPEQTENKNSNESKES